MESHWRSSHKTKIRRKKIRLLNQWQLVFSLKHRSPCSNISTLINTILYYLHFKAGEFVTSHLLMSSVITTYRKRSLTLLAHMIPVIINKSNKRLIFKDLDKVIANSGDIIMAIFPGAINLKTSQLMRWNKEELKNYICGNILNDHLIWCLLSTFEIMRSSRNWSSYYDQLITKLDSVCPFNQSYKTSQQFGWFELDTCTSPVEKQHKN